MKNKDDYPFDVQVPRGPEFFSKIFDFLDSKGADYMAVDNFEQCLILRFKTEEEKELHTAELALLGYFD